MIDLILNGYTLHINECKYSIDLNNKLYTLIFMNNSIYFGELIDDLFTKINKKYIFIILFGSVKLLNNSYLNEHFNYKVVNNYSQCFLYLNNLENKLVINDYIYNDYINIIYELPISKLNNNIIDISYLELTDKEKILNEFDNNYTKCNSNNLINKIDKLFEKNKDKLFIPDYMENTIINSSNILNNVNKMLFKINKSKKEKNQNQEVNINQNQEVNINQNQEVNINQNQEFDNINIISKNINELDNYISTYNNNKDIILKSLNNFIDNISVQTHELYEVQLKIISNEIKLNNLNEEQINIKYENIKKKIDNEKLIQLNKIKNYNNKIINEINLLNNKYSSYTTNKNKEIIELIEKQINIDNNDKYKEHLSQLYLRIYNNIKNTNILDIIEISNKRLNNIKKTLYEDHINIINNINLKIEKTKSSINIRKKEYDINLNNKIKIIKNSIKVSLNNYNKKKINNNSSLVLW